MLDVAAWIQDRFFSLEHKYDPVKAREYYLRTRELKGRKPGSQEIVGEGRSGPNTSSASPTRSSAGPVKATATAAPASQPSNAAALRQAATKRQAMLRARLERLETVLAQLTEKAKEAAGVETTESSTSSKEPEKSDSSKEKEKPKTAAEKKEAAKKAQEDYEKNKTPETNDSAQDLQNKIEAVQKQIADARETIRAAIERARAQKPPPKATSTATPSKSGGAPTSSETRSGTTRSSGGAPTRGKKPAKTA